MKTISIKDYYNQNHEVVIDHNNTASCFGETINGITMYYLKPYDQDDHYFDGEDDDIVLLETGMDRDWEELFIYDATLEEIRSFLRNGMEGIASIYNEGEDLDVPTIESLIDIMGYENDLDQEFGVCHNDEEKVTINDEGKAVVVDIIPPERLAIGQRIAELRKEKGLSQRDLAALCNLPQPHIARIERGQNSTQLDTLTTIANALGAEVKILLKS